MRILNYVVISAAVGMVATSGRLASAEVVHAVACGSPVRIFAEGTVFSADQLYNGRNGFGAVGGEAVAPLSEKVAYLLQDRAREDLGHLAQQRVGPEGYRFEVENGTYELTIHLAGFARDGIGTGVLTVLAEAETLFAGFDLNAEVGKARATELRSLVEVSDGLLDVDFADSRGDHDIGAISIRNAENTGRPGPVVGLEALDTHGGVLLRWDRNLERDLAGYTVLRSVSSGWETVAERLIPAAFVATDTTTAYAVVARNLYGGVSDTSYSAVVGPRSPTASPLPGYEIIVDPANLRLLDEDVQQDVEVLGTIVADGMPRAEVGLSYRGKNSRDAPKKSWNVDLNGAEPVHGVDRLVLKATFPDDTIQRELLMADLLDQGNVPHSITFPVRLDVNGSYSGVYMDIERLDQDFLTRIGRENSEFYRSYCSLGVLPEMTDYIYSFRVAAGSEDWGRRSLIELVESIANVPDADILPWLEANVDVDEVISLYCHYMWSGSRDWLGDDHFLLRAPADSLWQMIPWDLHETWLTRFAETEILFGTSAVPNSIGNYNRLVDRILSVPSLMRRYIEMMRSHGAGHLSPANIHNTITERHREMEADVERDVQKRPRELSGLYQGTVTELMDFMAAREASVLPQLDALEPPEHVLVHLSELEPAADGKSVRAVEILNLSDRAFDLEDFYLSGDRGEPLEWPIETAEIGPRGRHVVELPTPVPVGGWVGLSRGGDDGAMVDSLEVPTLFHALRGYGRYPETGGRWRFLDATSMGSPNLWTNPVDWQLTVREPLLDPGGTVTLWVDITSAESFTLEGELQLFVKTLEGIGQYGGSVFSLELDLPPGAEFTGRGTLPVPPRLTPGGYQLELRYVLDGDDVLAADTREVFARGDGPGTLVVNELMAKNDTTLADEWGDYDDWVEIYNDTSAPISLDGYYLTDDLYGNPFRFALPSETLGPRERLIIWCDGDIEQGTHHTDFKLDAGGEEVAIVAQANDGTPLRVDYLVFGDQAADVSFGRYPDGLPSLLVQDSASPGDANRYTPQ